MASIKCDTTDRFVEEEEFSESLITSQEDNILQRKRFQNEKRYIHAKIPRFSNGILSASKTVIVTSIFGISVLLVTCIVFFCIYESGSEQYENPVMLKSLQLIETKEKLLNYFRDITGSKTISGVYQNYGTTRNDGVENIHNITGLIPGMVNLRMPKYNANKTEWDHFATDVITYWNLHYLVQVGWRNSENPLDFMPVFDFSYNTAATDTEWKDMVEEGGHRNKIWKEQLDLIVPYFKQIQNAGVITLLDILPIICHRSHEGRGIPGVNGTVKLYKLTRDYLTKHHNLTSLVWMWTVDIQNSDMTLLSDFWPGNDYVDTVSVYMWDYTGLSTNRYQRLKQIIGDKPLSMEYLYHIPTPSFLANQPWWTWFTVANSYVKSRSYNTYDKINFTINSHLVINHGSIAFFNGDI